MPTTSPRSFSTSSSRTSTTRQVRSSPWRLATRGSRLALVQARLAIDALQRHYPDQLFELEVLETHGDHASSMNLAEPAQEGVFVKELERALLEGRAELAVHSAKDLPTADTPGLALAAFLPRADARDALVGRKRKSLAELPSGAVIATGSPRRSAQLKSIRPDLQIKPIRGNVDTRLRKLREGAADALVLAVAGLERLGLAREIDEIFPFDVMLPAPAQGALVMQTVEGGEAAALAKAVDDPGTRRAVEAERKLLRELGGGCLSSTGAFAEVVGAQLRLRAAMVNDDDGRLIRSEAIGSDDRQVIQQVVNDLSGPRSSISRAATSGARSLAGLRVLVTRRTEQARPFLQELEREGARVILCPVIDIEPLPVDRGHFARAVAAADWIVFTSANSVDRFKQLLDDQEPPPLTAQIAAIGPPTRQRLEELGFSLSVMPEAYVAEALADALGPLVSGKRVVLPRAAGARDVLPERLRQSGARVDVFETYRAVRAPGLKERLRRVLQDGVDVVTFASSSSVRSFAEAIDGELDSSLQVACIGPVTAEAAKELGIRVDIIAEEYTANGLVDALRRRHALSRK